MWPNHLGQMVKMGLAQVLSPASPAPLEATARQLGLDGGESRWRISSPKGTTRKVSVEDITGMHHTLSHLTGQRIEQPSDSQ